MLRVIRAMGPLPIWYTAGAPASWSVARAHGRENRLKRRWDKPKAAERPGQSLEAWSELSRFSYTVPSKYPVLEASA